jgi:hypothetical protein
VTPAQPLADDIPYRIVVGAVRDSSGTLFAASPHTQPAGALTRSPMPIVLPCPTATDRSGVAAGPVG